MSAPVFRDPLFDGATDPTVIRREGTDQWWMFYTQRRPDDPRAGVEWVHGSRIGVAVSTDGRASWTYRGVVDGLDEPGGVTPNTHWAPEVVHHAGEYHLFLTWIAGVPGQWAGHPRSIVHFRSADLASWTRVGTVPLSSDRVIDAAVAPTIDGRFRLWYKDEAAGSHTFSAVSADLTEWVVDGEVVGGRPHEGANVFALGGRQWLIVDEWRGLGVYRSTDGECWVRQEALILAEPGTHPLDRQVGRHADVVVDSPSRATIYYFTHPHWGGEEIVGATRRSERVSAIHEAALSVEPGVDGEPELVARR